MGGDSAGILVMRFELVSFEPATAQDEPARAAWGILVLVISVVLLCAAARRGVDFAAVAMIHEIESSSNVVLRPMTLDRCPPERLVW